VPGRERCEDSAVSPCADHYGAVTLTLLSARCAAAKIEHCSGPQRNVILRHAQSHQLEAGITMNNMRIRTRAWLNSCCSILFVLTLIFFVLVDHAFARRAIPNDYLAYPILITLKTETTFGYGCGFYLSTDRAMYLVTAKHVLAEGLLPADPATQKFSGAELELLSYSTDLPIRKRILLAVNLETLQKSGDVIPHQSQDVVVVKLATKTTTNSGTARSISFLPGVTIKEFAESGVLGVPVAAVKGFDQVAVGNDAILYGYPISLGIPNNPQFDPVRPLLRKALVAGRDPQKRSIILDGPAYRRNSGGPVFEIDPDGDGYKLIGIVIDRLNPGYSVVKPMDFVLELIK